MSGAAGAVAITIQVMEWLLAMTQAAPDAEKGWAALMSMVTEGRGPTPEEQALVLDVLSDDMDAAHTASDAAT